MSTCPCFQFISFILNVLVDFFWAMELQFEMMFWSSIWFLVTGNTDSVWNLHENANCLNIYFYLKIESFFNKTPILEFLFGIQFQKGVSMLKNLWVLTGWWSKQNTFVWCCTLCYKVVLIGFDFSVQLSYRYF